MSTLATKSDQQAAARWRVDSPQVGASARRLPRVRWWAVVLLSMAGLAIIVGNERVAAPPRFGRLAATPSPEPITSFRVATFNIDTGHRRTGELDLPAVAAALRGCDLAALQEVDGPAPWRGADQAAQLARLLGCGAAFAPTERRWGLDHVGNAILSRLEVPSWQSIPQIGTQRRGHRNLVLARVCLGEGVFVNVLATHVDRQQDRELQLAAACALFQSLAEPAILLGDLNTHRHDAHLQALFAAGARDALDDAGVTTSADRIDWVILRGLRGKAGGELMADVSDHPCVWADVVLDASVSQDVTARR